MDSTVVAHKRVPFRSALAVALPHVRTSPNALKATEIALGFIAGLGGSLLAYRQGVVTFTSFSVRM